MYDYIKGILTKITAKTVVETERQLMEVLDRDLWSEMHHVLIFHGRYCCHARKPACDSCPVREDCRYLRELEK